MMNRDVDIAYMAGVMDSDGWFTIHKNTKQSATPIYSPGMGLNQVEPQAIDLAIELWGGKKSTIDYSKHASNRFSTRSMFNWRPNKPDMVIIVNEILPYLRIKAERGEIILRLAADIAFYKGRTGGRGKFSLPSEVGVFREKLYQQFQATKNTPVAETECVGSTDSKEEKRQSDLHGDMQSSVETSEPLCGDANAT